MKITAIKSYQSSVTPKQNIKMTSFLTSEKNDSVTFGGLNLMRIMSDQPKKKAALIKLFVDNYFDDKLAKKSKSSVLDKIKKDITKEIKKNALIDCNNTPCTDIMMLSENGKMKGGFSLFITNNKCRLNFIALSSDLNEGNKSVQAFFKMGQSIKQICESKDVETITCEVESKNKNYIKLLEKIGLKVKSGFQVKMLEADIDDFMSTFL